MIYEANVNVYYGCECLTSEGERLEDVVKIDTEQKQLVRRVLPLQINETGEFETYETTFDSVDITFMEWKDGVKSDYPNRFVIHGLKK